MKAITPIIFSLNICLLGCASSGTSTSTGRLPDGVYILNSYDSEGNVFGRPIDIVMPFSDLGFSIGAMCMDPQSVTVKAVSKKTGAETVFKCSRKTKSKHGHTRSTDAAALELFPCT